MNGVVRVCSKVVRKKQVSLEELYERRVRKKGKQIASDSTYVLAKHYECLPSGRRYRTFKVKARAARTFIPNLFCF